MSVTDLVVDRFVATVPVAAPEGTRARVSEAQREVARRHLAGAWGRVDVPPGHWCIARLDCLLDDGVTDAALGEAWAARLTEALRAALRDGAPGVVHYPREADARADAVRELARGRTERAWAWRQLDLLPAGAEDLPGGEAVLSLLRRAPEHALGCLTRVAAGDGNGRGAALLDRALGAAGWRAAAELVWRAHGGTSTDDRPGTEVTAAAVRHAGPAPRSELARALSASGVRPAPAQLRAWARLVAVAEDPLVPRRAGAEDRVRSTEAALATALGLSVSTRAATAHRDPAPPAAGVPVPVVEQGPAAPPPRHEPPPDGGPAFRDALGPYVGRAATPPRREPPAPGQPGPGQPGTPRPADAAAITEDVRPVAEGAEPTAGPAAAPPPTSTPPQGPPPAGSTTPRRPDDRPSILAQDPPRTTTARRGPLDRARRDTGPGTAATPPPAAGSTDDQGMRTDWGGLPFLLAVAPDAGLPDRLDDPAFAGHTPAWWLTAVATRLTGAPRTDAGALALAGMPPGAEPPDADEPPETESEGAALGRLTADWAEAVAERLRSAGRPVDDAAAAVTGVVRRAATVVGERGWIEVHLAVADVDLDVRMSGLDLDPGWVPWLGAVVRYVYE